MSLLLLSLVLASFAVLAALFLRLQKDLNECATKVAVPAVGRSAGERPCEFYNAFADRQPRGGRTVLHREAA